MSKKITWYKLAESVAELQLNENGLAQLAVAGKQVCVSLHKETVHACAAKCPHASGLLANGFVDALGNIVCPLHRYRFDLKNGRNVSGEGYFLKTYPIEWRNDGIYIGFEENNGFNWLK